MKSSEAFPSKYLRVDDIIGMRETFTLGAVTMEKFEDPKTGEKSVKPVAVLKETDKCFIINKTNWERIAAIHGDESDDWFGKQITLCLEEVSAFGKTQHAIRVKG